MPPFLQQRAAMEIVNAFGVLRATIDYKYPLTLLLFEVLGLTGVTFYGWERLFLTMPGGRGPIYVAVFTALNLVALGYQLTASQTIELNDRQLVISRTNLGWQRTSAYALEKCSHLEWRKYWGKPGSFRCKVGWRTISFAKYLSDEQANRLIAELRNSLPDVARRLLGLAAVAGR
jgi:hypothetical protein